VGIDYSQLPLSKGQPRVLLKALKDKAEEKHRKDIKAKVFARDKGKCRVCGSQADEMHELDFRSLGGKRSLENSIAVCIFRGNNCHRYLQTHAIDVEGSDANARLVFHWNRSMVKKGEEPFRIKSKRRSQDRE
jgi:hypothetical protein